MILQTRETVANQHPEPEGLYIITHYSISDGLPSKTVTDVTFGRDKYLYIASVNGLIRMDGHHIDVFSTNNDSGFKSDRISRIFNLSPNALIIKDHQNDVYLFSNEKADPLINERTGNQVNSSVIKAMSSETYLLLDQQYVYRLSEDSLTIIRESLSSYSIWDGEYEDGTIYLLNTDGFYKSAENGYEKIIFPEDYKPDLTFFSRIERVDDHFRIIGRQKSSCYNPTEEEWCLIHSFALEDEQEEILNIKEEDNGFLITTSEGFYLQKDGMLTQAYGSSKGIRFESTFKTDYGDILVGSNGVWINEELVFEPQSRIDDAALDSDGGLWISSSQDGVYNIRKNKFLNYTDNAIVNSYSIVKDENNNYWAGSFEYGLITWNGDENKVYNQENGSLPSNTIRMISPLKNGGVLVSVWGEPPFIFKDETIEQLTGFWPLFGNRTNVTEAFYEDETGRFWFGTLEGLYVKQGNRYLPFFDRNQMTLSDVTKIVDSPFNDDVYFCTANQGLVLLRNNQFHYLSEGLPASAKHVRDAYVASEDTIWVASYNSGLQRFIVGDDPKNLHFSELNYQMGLEDAGYHRIIPDSLGSFWISTNNGLLQVSEEGLNHSVDSGFITTTLNWFREEDGLIDREFNGGSQNTGFYDNGKIWFTNMSGLVSFSPYSFYDNKLTSENFSLQKAVTSGGDVKEIKDKIIELDKSERQIELKFAHISYDKNRTDQIWVKISENGKWIRPERSGFVNVNELKGGKTKIYFSEGPGASILAGVSIIVSPYLYERVGVRIFAVLLVVLFGFIFIKNRLQKSDNSVDRGTENEAEFVPETIKGRIKILLHEHFKDSGLTIDTIAEKLSVSRSTLYRTWNEKNDESILEYLSNLRLEYAKKLIKDGELTITEIAYESGFASQSYFTKVFKKKYGITPTDYAIETKNEGGTV